MVFELGWEALASSPPVGTELCAEREKQVWAPATQGPWRASGTWGPPGTASWSLAGGGDHVRSRGAAGVAGLRPERRWERSLVCPRRGLGWERPGGQWGTLHGGAMGRGRGPGS